MRILSPEKVESMYLAVKRRKRDRLFIPYQPEVHLPRAYVIGSGSATAWDLFPPPHGYRAFNENSARTHTVSLIKQQADWSALVMKRDGYICKQCGSTKQLEAHHIWPQGGYENLRYLLNNGVTLCRPCHKSAYHAPELTPGQFLQLSSDQTEINANIESEGFWSHYTAGEQKGRALAYSLMARDEMKMSDVEMNWFLSVAKINLFVERSKRSAWEAPIVDREFTISPEIEAAIEAHDAFR